MPHNCKKVSTEDVVKFFIDEIDGMGRFDGYPRNHGVPDSIQLSEWKLCELTEDEFMRLQIPDGTGTLVKEKRESTFDNMVKFNVKKRLKILNSGDSLFPLIVRERILGDANDSSFYIEDGSKRAITLKVYFEKNPYNPVLAYIGVRSDVIK